MENKWVPEQAEDGDKILCMMCGKTHILFQGSMNGARVGDGVLFYKCGSRTYIGSINKKTAFGVTYHD
jgi:hypothetical protein